MYAIWYGYDRRSFSFVRGFESDIAAVKFAECVAYWTVSSDKQSTTTAFYHIEEYEATDEDQRKRLIEDSTFRPEFATVSVKPVN